MGCPSREKSLRSCVTRWRRMVTVFGRRKFGMMRYPSRLNLSTSKCGGEDCCAMDVVSGSDGGDMTWFWVTRKVSSGDGSGGDRTTFNTQISHSAEISHNLPTFDTLARNAAVHSGDF